MTSVSAADAQPVLPPAPGDDLHAALELVNTLQSTPAGVVDLIAVPASATAWLVRRGLLAADARLAEPCTARLHALRGQLRILLISRTQDLPPPDEALAAVNNAIASAPTARLLVWDRRRGMHRSAKHPLDQATERVLAVIAADAADLLCGSDADKLAACGAPRCSRFLLRTHAARQWCSVRCGDRVRAARAYARRAERRGVGQAAPQS